MITLPTLFLSVLSGLLTTGEGDAGLVAVHDHEPFVFRSVLDGRPRMITAALDPDLWMAWDATTCSLYRAWRGDVEFDGAVYTTVHGPQPTSRGASYLELDEALRWELVLGGDECEETFDPGVPRYLGYRLEGRALELHYEVVFHSTIVVKVVLRPSVSRDGDRILLRRRYRAEGVPQHGTLTAFGIDGTQMGRVFAGGKLLAVATSHDIPAEPTEELAPAEDDARTYAPEEEPRGVRPAPTGEFPVETLLDGHDAFGPRERGVSLRVYDVDVGLEKLPALIDGQTPNVNAVVPRVELFGPEAFGGIEDSFVAVVTGLLETTDGTYAFRLSSDDGSSMTLDGELLIDNDGLHGHSGVEATVELEAGLHDFEIRHFENGGSESLLLEWRPPGKYELEIVPDEAFSCAAGEVRVTSPGAKEVATDRKAGGPGDGQPLEDVHPSYDLARVRPEGFEPRVGGMDWLSDGTLVLCTWDADGAVYTLEGVDGDDPEEVTIERIAWGLAEPLGLAVVDDRIFVLQKQELTELVDTDGDGEIEEYRCVSSGWDVTANFHEFAFGLVHRGGHFYANLAIAIDPGGASTQPQEADRGTTIRIDPETGRYEVVARGLRTPNGIGIGAAGEVFLTDNQGDWLPCSKLLRLEEGAFYGQRSVLLEAAAKLEVTPPVVWLPQGEIGNSPSQPAVIPPGHGPYSGQMIHGEVTHGGVKRVFLEEHSGVLQGAVFRFTQGLEAGINRLTFGPHGGLYVGGIGSTGNWGQEGKQRFGLERLKYNGTTAFEMLAVRAFANGFEVELTEPIAGGAGWDPFLWEVTQYRYEPTAEYGGPKLDEEHLYVQSSTPDADRQRIFVEVAGLQPDRVVHLRIAHPVTSASQRRLWTTEAWYTMNRVPRSPGPVPEDPDNLNAITDEEREEGWELLFDGDGLDAWRGFRREDVPDGWQAVYGTLSRVGGGGDLITRETYEDFELELEWRISRAGNSGIFFHVTEDYGAVWQTGPEMQVLDNAAHPDGGGTLTSAGANYALHAPTRDVTRPVGQWNEVLLRVYDTRVEHWLNGVKVVEYHLGDAKWDRLAAQSKFSQMPGYGRAKSGHIALQDHGDPVSFRNLKIRRL